MPARRASWTSFNFAMHVSNSRVASSACALVTWSVSRSRSSSQFALETSSCDTRKRSLVAVNSSCVTPSSCIVDASSSRVTSELLHCRRQFLLFTPNLSFVAASSSCRHRSDRSRDSASRERSASNREIVSSKLFTHTRQELAVSDTRSSHAEIWRGWSGERRVVGSWGFRSGVCRRDLGERGRGLVMKLRSGVRTLGIVGSKGGGGGCPVSSGATAIA